MEKHVFIKSGRYNLSGFLSCPEHKTGFPMVIMCHGFTGSKSESHFIFTKTARYLLKKGIGSLRFDFMGSGDSEGMFEKMTLRTEINDAKSAVAFLGKEGLLDCRKTGVLGLSMGSVAAVRISSLYGFRSLLLWSPVANLEKLGNEVGMTGKIKREISEKGKAYFPLIGHSLGKGFLDSVRKIDPLKFAMDYKGHVLIIHSKDDEGFPVENPISYFKAFHKNGIMPELLILKEGGHTFKTEFAESTVMEETADFFTRTLV